MGVADPRAAAKLCYPVKITDEIAQLSAIKGVCLRNSVFDIESYGINVLFKERTIKKKMSYILCTLFENQTEGTICANMPWHTTTESKITHKPDLNVHATYTFWVVIS